MRKGNLWIASGCLLLGLTRLLWAGAPDAVVRTLGVVLLIALPAFAYTTVKLVKKQK